LVLTGKALVATPGPADKLIAVAKASNELTIEAWVRPENASQRAAYIVTLSANARERNVRLRQDRKRYQVYLRTTQPDDASTDRALRAGEVATGTLSHLVYTRDGSGQARFDLNSVQVGDGHVEGKLSNWDDGYRLGLGNELTGTKPWQGELHLVAIYNRALSPEEVAQNYDAGAGT
jgi:long-subunit fatty acid transport protein